MSDTTPWQSPGGSAPTPPASGLYGPPQPQFGPPQPAAGWTPPPKPGLIPLRPLTLGTILGAAFQVLRRNPRPTFGFSLLVTSVITVVALGVVGAVSFLAVARTATATGTDAETLAAGSVAMIVVSALVPIALGVVGGAILQGIIALEVARGTLGEKLRLGGLFRAARGRIGALIGWSALLTTALVTGIIVISLVLALIVALGGQAGIVIAVLLGLLLGLGGVVLVAWLATKLSLVPSVLLLERLPLRAAVARSWSLTGGCFWKTLGIQLLVLVMINVATGIVTTPLSVILGLGTALINPNGDMDAAVATFVVVNVLLLVVSLVFGALAAVVQAATPALIYIDIRMRKEGLDLELSRFVEARQAGDTSVADPYLVRASAASSSTS